MENRSSVKPVFEEPKTEFILFSDADVITTSGPTEFEEIKE